MPTPLEATLERVTLGEPEVFRNLALFPILSDGDSPPDYVTLAEALESGRARVTELSSGGSVPELLLDNPSPARVLLLDGDELVGAKQNRALNLTILVGARQKIVIPVSCVERGRWHARSEEFRIEDRMMFAKGRAAKMAQVSHSMRTTGSRRSDQGAVWASVGSKVDALGASAPTEAMGDVYEHARADVAAFRGAFRASPRQVGALFVIDGRSVGLELFDAPATFARALARLVGSYALDAIERPAGSRPAPLPDRDEAAAFLSRLSRAAQAGVESAKAVGEGDDLRLEAAGLVGEALVVDGRVVHLSALSLDRGEETGGGRGPGGGARRGGDGAVLPFRLEHGHVVARIDGGRWLVDTGSPWTFGSARSLRLLEREHAVPGSIMGFSLGEIVEEIGRLGEEADEPFALDGLLGCDLLAGLTLEIRWDRQEIALTGRPSSTRPRPTAALPRAQVRVGARSARAIVDTGAWCTYVASRLLDGVPRTGERADFLIGAGRFESQIAIVDLGHDQISGPIAVSVAPPLVSALIEPLGAAVILGLDAMSRSPVTRIAVPG